MPIPALAITTVELPVADLARAGAWYRKALGFEIEWSDPDHALLSHMGGGVQLLLVQTDQPQRFEIQGKAGAGGVVHGAFDLRTPDLDALHAHLTGLGARVDPLGPAAHEWAPRGFGFWDSEGNRLGAFAAPRPR